MKTKIKVQNITCSNCAQTIKNAIGKEYPDLDVRVNINTATVHLNGEYDIAVINKALAKAGYPAEGTVPEPKKRDKHKTEMIAGILLSLPLLWSMFGHFDATAPYVPMIVMNGYVQFVIGFIVQFWIGRTFYVSAYHGLKNKVLGMDILVVLGTTTAFFYSSYNLFISTNPDAILYFEVGALVIVIVTIGKYLEHKVKEKTAESLNELVNLGSKQALVVKGDEQKLVDIQDLEIGDVILCLANEKIAIDGEIIDGSSMVDESTFTGESVAVLKEAGAQVLGGSLNLTSSLYIKVTTLDEDTVLSQIISAVEEASLVQTKFQRIADRIAGVFVPIIIVIAIFVFFINLYVLGDMSESISRALSVILISCPCALGLATPTSIMVANGVAAKRGILYKGGVFFEIGHKVQVIFFDKTGTLTTGVPKLEYSNIDVKNLPIIYNVEKMSNHPISKAFTLAYENIEEIEVEDYTSIPGLGVVGIAEGKEVMVGNERLFKEKGIDTSALIDQYEEQKQKGLTVNIVAIDGECVGIYGVRDEIKQTSYKAIQNLKKANIKTVMITGDNEVVANSIAQILEIDEVYSKVMPTDKADIVKKYKDQGYITGFIGDGINDTVALTVADVAMTVSNGNDIAISSSDVMFLRDDLNLILDGIKISKATTINIYQNLFWAFSYNLVAVPLASMGYLNMIVAGFAMGFSSILVLLNAVRLKRMKLD